MPIPPMGARHRRRAGPLLYWGLALALVVGGCALEDRPTGTGAVILLPEAVYIPAGSAHARFQGGHQVGATNRLDPYCELEIRTISDRPQQASPGRHRVVGERFTLLLDPTTRLPALITGFSCSDPLFQESFWRLTGEAGDNLHSLRCIRPIYHCAMVPPLTLDEVGTVTGPTISVEPSG